MNFADAALLAFYPLIIFLCLMIFWRFLPVVRTLEGGVRVLVCAMLILVGGIMWEQALFGFGRIVGNHVDIVTEPGIVQIGKLLYAIGGVYMLYAFWLIKPTQIKFWNYPVVAVIVWMVLTFALML